MRQSGKIRKEKAKREPEIITIKPWPENDGRDFNIRIPLILQAKYTTPRGMYRVCEQIQSFAVSCGFSEDRSAEICITISEALDNARKAILNGGVRQPITVTAICNPGVAIIIFIQDSAGMMGVSRMKDSKPHDVLSEHGRGTFLMKAMSNFMAILGSPRGRKKSVVLGFYAG